MTDWDQVDRAHEDHNRDIYDSCTDPECPYNYSVATPIQTTGAAIERSVTADWPYYAKIGWDSMANAVKYYTDNPQSYVSDQASIGQAKETPANSRLVEELLEQYPLPEVEAYCADPQAPELSSRGRDDLPWPWHYHRVEGNLLGFTNRRVAEYYDRTGVIYICHDHPAGHQIHSLGQYHHHPKYGGMSSQNPTVTEIIDGTPFSDDIWHEHPMGLTPHRHEHPEDAA